MSTPEGDELLAMIRHYVHGRIPPIHEEVTVEIVAKVIVAIVSEPRFYTSLAIVQNLQSRVTQLEFALARYAEKERRGSPAARPGAKAKKAMPVKKISKKPPLPHNVKAFKRGAQGY